MVPDRHGMWVAVQREMAANGAQVKARVVNMSSKTSTSSATPLAQTCTKSYHHWCLDNKSISPSGVRGIIAGGVIFVVLVAALLGYAVYRRSLRRRPNRGAWCTCVCDTLAPSEL